MKTFRQFSNHVVTALVCGLTAAAVLLLAFVLFFIVKEALPLFDTVGVSDFLLGQKWMPVDYTGVTSFGIFNFIAATAYVSLTGLVLAAGIGLGTAMFLAFQATPRMRTVMYPLIDLLAGIPSVIYGFIGLSVLVKLFLKAGVHTGSCVLAAGILLAVMLLPYLVSSCCDTMLKERKKYLEDSAALGVSDWYAAATMILPAAMPNMLMSMVLAVGRAMGETMAVMMVMGNAHLLPKFLGESESIASVIALEMGSAVYGSPHYHALYAAGMVLVVLLMMINLGIHMVRKYLMGGNAV